MDKVIDDFAKKENPSLGDSGGGGGSSSGNEKRSNETMGNDLNDILAKYF